MLRLLLPFPLSPFDRITWTSMSRFLSQSLTWIGKQDSCCHWIVMLSRLRSPCTAWCCCPCPVLLPALPAVCCIEIAPVDVACCFCHATCLFYKWKALSLNSPILYCMPTQPVLLAYVVWVCFCYMRKGRWRYRSTAHAVFLDLRRSAPGTAQNSQYPLTISNSSILYNIYIYCFCDHWYPWFQHDSFLVLVVP